MFCEKIVYGDIATHFVSSNDKLVDVFTKSLGDPRIDYICNELGAYDLCTNGGSVKCIFNIWA